MAATEDNSVKKPRISREVQNLLQFNAVLDGTPKVRKDDRNNSRTRRRERDGDDIVPAMLMSVNVKRFPRKLLTRPTGVGGERIVVFVDPMHDEDDFWPPAMVVPTVEWDASMGRVRPGECVVRYFEDNSYSVVPANHLALFIETDEPFISFSQYPAFLQSKGAQQALRLLREGILPNGFKWQNWDDSVGVGIEEWEVERSQRSSRLAEKAKQKQAKEENATTPKENPEIEAFKQQLLAFMEQRGTPIQRMPVIGFHQLDLYRLYNYVMELGGFHKVTEDEKWRDVYEKLEVPNVSSSSIHSIRSHYEKYLLPYELRNTKKSPLLHDSAESPGSAKSDPNRGYGQGEKVLVYSQRHGRQYPAKILQCKTNDGGLRKYFVHYTGWKTCYDEWVPEVYILKHLDDDEAINKLGVEHHGPPIKNPEKDSRSRSSARSLDTSNSPLNKEPSTPKDKDAPITPTSKGSTGGRSTRHSHRRSPSPEPTPTRRSRSDESLSIRSKSLSPPAAQSRRKQKSPPEPASLPERKRRRSMSENSSHELEPRVSSEPPRRSSRNSSGQRRVAARDSRSDGEDDADEEEEQQPREDEDAAEKEQVADSPTVKKEPSDGDNIASPDQNGDAASNDMDVEEPVKSEAIDNEEEANDSNQTPFASNREVKGDIVKSEPADDENENADDKADEEDDQDQEEETPISATAPSSSSSSSRKRSSRSRRPKKRSKKKKDPDADKKHQDKSHEEPRPTIVTECTIDWPALFPGFEDWTCEQRIENIMNRMKMLRSRYLRYKHRVDKYKKSANGSHSTPPAASTHS